MKKLTAIVFAALLCMSVLISLPVSAETPYFTPIKAVVSNKDGARMYDYIDIEQADPVAVPLNGKVPYGREFTLRAEDKAGDKTYYLVTEEDKSFLLDSDDLFLKLKPVKPKKKNAYVPVQHFAVVNKDGLPLREGPNDAYKKLAVVPEGAVVEATHADALGTAPPGKETDFTFSAWSYVTYEGVSGWMYTYEFSGDAGRSVKYRDNPAPLLGKAETTLPLALYDTYDGEWTDGAKMLAEIPAGTKLSFDTYCGNQALVTYGGNTGWVSCSRGNSKLYIDGALMPLTDLPLYSKDNSSKKNLTGKTAPGFEHLTYDLVYEKRTRDPGEDESPRDVPYEVWFRVNVNGEKLWVCVPEGKAEYQILEVFRCGYAYRLAPGTNLKLCAVPAYRDFLWTLEGGTCYYTLFSYKDWVYVKSGDCYGWTQTDPDEEFLPGNTIYSTGFDYAVKELADEEDDGFTDDNPDLDLPDTDGIIEDLENILDDLDIDIDSPDSSAKNNPTPAQALRRPGNIGGFIFYAAVTALAVTGIIRAKKKEEQQ